MKSCTKCKAEKPFTEFYRSKSHKDGYQSWCKECHKAREWNPDWWAGYYEKNREKRIAQQRAYVDSLPKEELNARQRRYYHNSWEKTAEREKWGRKYRNSGVTKEAYETRVAELDGKCALCRQEPTSKGLVIDHDHTTRYARDLLCGKCNPGIGLFNDDPDLLRAAAEYIEYYRERDSS